MTSNLRDLYQQFQQLLQQLQVQSAEQIANQPAAQAAWRTSVSQIQQLFQAEIVSVSSETAASAAIQPIQTEINKQLRLLETDVVFLQAARHAATVQQRQQQIHERLKTLLQYCDAVQAILLESDHSSPQSN